MEIEPVKLEGIALTEHINRLNAKVLANEPVSDDEIRAAILAIRPHRKLATATSGAGKKASSAAPMTSEDIMGLFEKPTAAVAPKPEQPQAKSKFDFDFGKGV